MPFARSSPSIAADEQRKRLRAVYVDMQWADVVGLPCKRKDTPNAWEQILSIVIFMGWIGISEKNRKTPDGFRIAGFVFVFLNPKGLSMRI